MQLKVILIPACFFFSRESMCHIHFLVIYKDVENPVSKNEKLQEELQDFKAELDRRWQCQSNPAKKSKLM